MLRSAKGMLLTAWQRLNASDPQLARQEYLALMEQSLELFSASGKYATEHQANAQDDKPHEQLHTDIKQWEAGSNTEKGKDGGKPIVAITAPAGISTATPQSIVSMATSNIDAIAGQHMQLTSGQRFNINAGKGISLFAHQDGIKHIAHYGKFLIQSQADDTQINAAKNVTITATEGKIANMAKELHLIAEDGSFIKIGGGITLGTNGAMAFKGAKFPFVKAGTMSVAFPEFTGSVFDHVDVPHSIRFAPVGNDDLFESAGLVGESYKIFDDAGDVLGQGVIPEDGRLPRLQFGGKKQLTLQIGKPDAELVPAQTIQTIDVVEEDESSEYEDSTHTLAEKSGKVKEQDIPSSKYYASLKSSQSSEDVFFSEKLASELAKAIPLNT